MHQKADNITPPINEQDLQAITGGCVGCKRLGRVAELRMIRLSQMNGSNADRENKIQNLQALAKFGDLNQDMPPQPNKSRCRDYPGMLREFNKNNE